VLQRAVRNRKTVDACQAENLAELSYHEEPLTGCVKEAVREFVRSITPHYVEFELRLRNRDDSAGGGSRHVTALLKRGAVFTEKGDVQAALDHFREAVKAKGDSPAANYNLGVILEITGALHQAEDYLEKAARLKPGGDYTEALTRIRERITSERKLRQQLR
jgi:tetratricopeptide (TPR) repeat protein